MSRTIEHTPLPWAVGGPTDVELDDWRDLTIAQDDNMDMRVAFLANDGTTANRVGRANAMLIVRACNNHYALIEALRWALAKLDGARKVCVIQGLNGYEMIRREAVLAKAEGK